MAGYFGGLYLAGITRDKALKDRKPAYPVP